MQLKIFSYPYFLGNFNSFSSKHNFSIGYIFLNIKIMKQIVAKLQSCCFKFIFMELQEIHQFIYIYIYAVNKRIIF